MTYNIEKQPTEHKDDQQRTVSQLVKVGKAHTMADFDRDTFVDVEYFLFESGHIQLDDNTKVELTRIWASCEEGHPHSVYYQSPREMELWEAMFSIGEVPSE